jgi:hypothetical protein
MFLIIYSKYNFKIFKKKIKIFKLKNITLKIIFYYNLYKNIFKLSIMFLIRSDVY